MSEMLAKKEYSREPNKDLTLEKRVDLDNFSFSFCKNNVGMLVKKKRIYGQKQFVEFFC